MMMMMMIWDGACRWKVPRISARFSSHPAL